jgi:hypothetical protein
MYDSSSSHHAWMVQDAGSSWVSGTVSARQ